jgi:hypothetical protein
MTGISRAGTVRAIFTNEARLDRLGDGFALAILEGTGRDGRVDLRDRRLVRDVDRLVRLRTGQDRHQRRVDHEHPPYQD